MARTLDECVISGEINGIGSTLRITMDDDPSGCFTRNTFRHNADAWFRRPANAPISARRSHTRLIVITGAVVVLTAAVLGLCYRRW